jgi:acyl carrier protein
VVSSRTPEGQPNRCPICGQEVRVEPSLFFGDAPCPSCGSLLWFVSFGDEARLFYYHESANLRQRVLEILAEKTDITVDELLEDPEAVENLGIDSLEFVELMMEIESQT